MKKLLTLTLAAVIIGFFATSCSSGNSENANGESDTTAMAKPTSKLYSDYVFKTGGDFLGVALGDTEDKVRSTWNEDELDYEDEGYNVEYFKDNGNGNELIYGAYFNEMGAVEEIYATQYSDNTDELEKLYQDLQAEFTAKYGDGELNGDESYEYYLWEKGDNNIELEFDPEYGVSVYMYNY